jgi:hypothetical protein
MPMTNMVVEPGRGLITARTAPETLSDPITAVGLRRASGGSREERLP